MVQSQSTLLGLPLSLCLLLLDQTVNPDLDASQTLPLIGNHLLQLCDLLLYQVRLPRVKVSRFLGVSLDEEASAILYQVHLGVLGQRTATFCLLVR